MRIEGKKIVDLPNLGSTNNGETIYFTLKTPSGEENTYFLSHNLVRNFVGGLMKAELLAMEERDRAGKKDKTLNVVNIEKINVLSGDKIPIVVFQMQTVYGWSLDFHIPVEVAHQLVEDLPDQLAKTESGLPHPKPPDRLQ